MITKLKKEQNIMSTKEMTAKVRELKELKAMAEELEAEITAIEDTIKAEMIRSTIKSLKGENKHMIKKEMPRDSRSCSGQNHHSYNNTYADRLSTGLRKLLDEENIVLSGFNSEIASELNYVQTHLTAVYRLLVTLWNTNTYSLTKTSASGNISLSYFMSWGIICLDI